MSNDERLMGWVQFPRLRMGEGERSATWLELFYDLVFVVAVAELAHVLEGDVSITGVLGFVVLFVPVWWAWIGSTFYATRFDTDDLGHRLLTIVEIFAVVAFAVEIHAGLSATSGGFALGYAAVRAILVGKYLGAHWNVPEARPLTRRYMLGFGADATLWFLSAFVPTPYRFGLWIIGLLVSFGTPLTAGQLHSEIPPHRSHLPERFGLFTIVVLGESVVSLVGGAVEQTWTIRSFLVGGFSLAIIFCLWWGYFEDLDGSEIRAAAEAGRTGVYQGWLYAHLPLVIGLTAVGISIERVLLASPGSSIPTTSRWLLCGALATCLFALGAIRYTAGARVDRSFTVSWAGRIGAGGVALLLGAVGGNLSPVVLCGVLVVVCIAPILLDFHEQYVYRSHEVES